MPIVRIRRGAAVLGFFGMAACGSSVASTAANDAGRIGADAGASDDGPAAVKGVEAGLGDSATLGAHDAMPVDGGSASDASVVPPPALAVGYTTQTFNSTTLGTTPGTWQNYTFFGISQPANDAVQNADGSLSLPGYEGDDFGATIATVAANASKPQMWQGIAFGGGGYFEATLSFTGTPDGSDKGGVGFWACDVEHSSGYLPTTAGHSWIEIDDLETDVASDSKWGESFHNWYNDGATGWANPPAIVNPVSIPNGGTFAGLHTYAFLWVPATATTQGYLKFFCDGIQTNGTVYWDLYDASQPFPPSGSDIGNVLDTLHLYLILGENSPSYPGTVTSVQVWQSSGSNNLTF